MSVHNKFEAGAPFPAFAWPKVGGGHITPGAGIDWRLLIVYRGAHCPLCTKYLANLCQLKEDFETLGVRLWALSADPLEKATSQVEREGWSIPVLAELKPDEMRTLGLYMSAPRSPQETDRDFSEPGAFLINPDGKVQIVDISNAPFARPDPASLLAGIRIIIEHDYPIRGTAD